MVTAMYQQPNSGVHHAHVIDDSTPQSYRQRPPQERRTPEVYGRASNAQNFNLGMRFPDSQPELAPQFHLHFNQKGQGTDLNMGYRGKNHPSNPFTFPKALHHQLQAPPQHHFYQKDLMRSSAVQRLNRFKFLVFHF